jgi:spore coat polysaccharide biosynthesis protein SpsF (cytidylyltransferase family)
MDTLAIIQARTGSTRLHNKICKPFYAGLSILELLVAKMQKTMIPFAIATTINPQDDNIAEYCETNLIDYFRGSENDVLDRFVKTAYNFNCKKILRVCSDNPFIDNAGLITLKEHLDEDDCDYVSFYTRDGRPSIKTNYGLWAEGVSLKALERCCEYTASKYHHEHVTSFIYSSPDLFKIKKLDMPNGLEVYDYIRLTVDTREDYSTASEIYGMAANQGLLNDLPSLFESIDLNENWVENMREEARRNSK